MSQPLDETEVSPDSTVLPASERYSLVVADRRRQALDILAGKTTQIELEELAVGIAAREHGSTSVDEETIERVAATLHHSHLPKLAESGVLDYDPESHLIDPDGVSTRLGGRPPFPSTE